VLGLHSETELTENPFDAAGIPGNFQTVRHPRRQLSNGNLNPETLKPIHSPLPIEHYSKPLNAFGKYIVPSRPGLVYLANALDGLSSGGASLALLKMLGIPSVASFPKGQESDRKIRPLKSRI